MNAITERRKRCPLCGHLLERYPDNGEPLIQGSVCFKCSNDAIVPYRYFRAIFKSKRWALYARQGKARMIETSDGKFTIDDIELYLGKGARIAKSQIPGLLIAYPKGYECWRETVDQAMLKAIKGVELCAAMAIPEDAMQNSCEGKEVDNAKGE